MWPPSVIWGVVHGLAFACLLKINGVDMLSERGLKILGCLLHIYCSRLHVRLLWLVHNLILFSQPHNHLI